VALLFTVYCAPGHSGDHAGCLYRHRVIPGDMTTIKRSALLPYSAARLYALVDDIESYPQYMDGCVGAEVLKREPGMVEARLHLARGGIRQSFATRNRLQEYDVIELELLEGPFDSFSGRWHFQQLGDLACKVSLDLEFQISNSVLGAAAARLFDSVTSSLVDSLARRAKQLYGPN
jgi:ribosome-associated toxin RatA of RatAB toxin-antitoxin module